MNEVFRFKRFAVRHDSCALKVGTDGVLLGAWCEPCTINTIHSTRPVGSASPLRILDIGTGSGVIALMLAQRFPQAGTIIGIDSDKQSAAIAAENFAESPWSDRLISIPSSLQDYTCSEAFDMIVSNPPYFNNSKENKDVRKYVARHTISLSHEDLLHKSAGLLKQDGCLCVIIPADIVNNFIASAKTFGLHLFRQTAVYTTAKSADPKRMLLSFSKTIPAGPIRGSDLRIKDHSDRYTPEYLHLTRDFYLFA